MKAYMIFDLQFGSTGKGLLAGYLANLYCPDVVITAWGPNAGHTYIDINGNEYIHRMLANGVVSPCLRTILIGPGSVIDTDILYKEISQCAHLLEGKKIIIHPHAAVLKQKHIDTEMKKNVSIGSTMKGTGAALVDRIRRDTMPSESCVAKDVLTPKWKRSIENDAGIRLSVCAKSYDQAVREANIIQIEGAQGYSLSMYHGMYPYVTSRDVTPHQVMADCALPFDMIPEVYGTARTFPIRVANRYKDGKEIGTSGPPYPDQKEITWEFIGRKTEFTTVTKLPRRLFTFSDRQIGEAIYRCRPKAIFLNFVNYLQTDMDVVDLITRINNIAGENIIRWIGTGPGHHDVRTMEDWARGKTTAIDSKSPVWYNSNLTNGEIKWLR